MISQSVRTSGASKPKRAEGPSMDTFLPFPAVFQLVGMNYPPPKKGKSILENTHTGSGIGTQQFG